MKYEIYASLNNAKLKPQYETIENVSLFVGKLKFFTEIGFRIHKIKRIE